MNLAEAKKYHVYALECLRLAEAAKKTDDRQTLLELSRVWMEAALLEVRGALENKAPQDGKGPYGRKARRRWLRSAR